MTATFGDAPPCDGIAHAWRILSPEEVAERYPGEHRSVAVATCCGAVAVLVRGVDESWWELREP